MKSNRFSRRKFLGISAAAAGATLATRSILLPDPLFALPQTPSVGERVRFG